MSRKVFTADEVLTAEDVNSFLMDQTVMSFAGTAARGSAIPSPVEGMVTYLEDINDIRVYDGAKWIGPSGSTLIVNQSFTSSTSVIVSNCFSADYDVYEILLLPTSGGTSPNFQLRTGGTTQTTNYDGTVILTTGGTGLIAAARASNAFFSLGNSSRDVAVVKLSYPFNTRTTSYLNFSQQTGNLVGIDGAWLSTTTSYESLVVNFTSSTSGNIVIYGMRK
jgi:hypothetical protein